MFQQPHSRLTQLTILTRFPCSECGNIKSRSIFSVNSINYSQSQLFSQDLLYHIFYFIPQNHFNIQGKKAFLSAKELHRHASEFNITGYNTAGSK